MIAMAKAYDAAVAKVVLGELEKLKKTPEYKSYESALNALNALRRELDKQVKAIDPTNAWDLNTGKFVSGTPEKK